MSVVEHVNNNIDFLEVMIGELNEEKIVYADIVTPVLGEGNGISMMIMPSSEYTHYYDGSYTQGFSFQIITKHREQMKAYYAITNLASLISSKSPKDSFVSKNDSYVFEGATISTSVNGLGRDENGYNLFAVQLMAKLYVPNNK